MSTIISKADVARLGLHNLAALNKKESEIMLKQQVVIDGTMLGTLVGESDDEFVTVDVGFGFLKIVNRNRIVALA